MAYDALKTMKKKIEGIIEKYPKDCNWNPSLARKIDFMMLSLYNRPFKWEITEHSGNSVLEA